MVITKVLPKNSVQSGKLPHEVLEEVIAQLCANNPADMFVTVWLGVVEISTGRLICANAGHEYPAQRQCRGSASAGSKGGSGRIRCRRAAVRRYYNAGNALQRSEEVIITAQMQERRPIGRAPALTIFDFGISLSSSRLMIFFFGVHIPHGAFVRAASLDALHGFKRCHH